MNTRRSMQFFIVIFIALMPFHASAWGWDQPNPWLKEVVQDITPLQTDQHVISTDEADNTASLLDSGDNQEPLVDVPTEPVASTSDTLQTSQLTPQEDSLVTTQEVDSVALTRKRSTFSSKKSWLKRAKFTKIWPTLMFGAGALGLASLVLSSKVRTVSKNVVVYSYDSSAYYLSKYAKPSFTSLLKSRHFWRSLGGLGVLGTIGYIYRKDIASKPFAALKHTTEQLVDSLMIRFRKNQKILDAQLKGAAKVVLSEVNETVKSPEFQAEVVDPLVQRVFAQAGVEVDKYAKKKAYTAAKWGFWGSGAAALGLGLAKLIPFIMPFIR